MIEARERLKEAQRIVVKIGTSSLVYPNGKTNLRRIQTLASTGDDGVSYAAAKEKLDKMYEQNCGKWLDGLFKKVLGQV